MYSKIGGFENPSQIMTSLVEPLKPVPTESLPFLPPPFFELPIGMLIGSRTVWGEFLWLLS